MSYKEQKSPAASITLDPTASITRQYSDLLNGTRTRYVDLLIEADYTIATAAASAILNRGSLLAAIDRIGLDENGNDQVNYDARTAGFITQMCSQSTVPSVRLSSTGAGTTHLVELVRMYFAYPYSIQPLDTAFREKDPTRKMRVFAILNASAAAKIATAGGGGTVTLGTVTITVTQQHDRYLAAPPLFRPYVRQWTDAIASANSDFRSDISFARFMRALVIQQDSSGVGEVNDIINSLAIRGDARDIIGPKQASWASLVHAESAEFGGDVYSATNYAYLGVNFSPLGRLNGMLNPAQDTNLRVELNVQPSVTAGAGSSIIRYTSIEMERVQGLTADQLPFQV